MHICYPFSAEDRLLNVQVFTFNDMLRKEGHIEDNPCMVLNLEKDGCHLALMAGQWFRLHYFRFIECDYNYYASNIHHIRG